MKSGTFSIVSQSPPLAERWHGTARSGPLAGRASPVECFTALEQRVPLQAWLSGPGRGASQPNRPIQE